MVERPPTPLAPPASSAGLTFSYLTRAIRALPSRIHVQKLLLWPGKLSLAPFAPTTHESGEPGVIHSRTPGSPRLHIFSAGDIYAAALFRSAALHFRSHRTQCRVASRA